MASQKLPLLVLPTAELGSRDKLPPAYPSVHFPAFLAQKARLAPQFKVLRDAQQLQLQHAAPTSDPDSVVVLETVGSVKDFARAVAKVPELVWLNEWESSAIDPDGEFYDEKDLTKKLGGQLYLIGTNHEALTQLLSLWNRWRSRQPFARGLGRWQSVFAQLKSVGFWDKQHRLTPEVLSYWRDLLEDGVEKNIRFEIEAWCYPDDARNRETIQRLSALVNELGGAIIKSAVIKEIGYHGILVTLPSAAIRRIVDGTEDQLVASKRIMFFRPRPQAETRVSEGEPEVHEVPKGAGDKAPVVALLDGLPMQNHPLLSNHLLVDDPDGWAAGYRPDERIHGTAMASLIIHDELDANSYVSPRKLYVRPVLRPDSNDGINQRRHEHIPDDVLIIDLIHRAVRRIFEGDAGEGPAASTVRIINLSLGDLSNPFVTAVSPWARLIDWLSWKHRVLFIVSAGNHKEPIICQVPGAQFHALTADQKIDLTLKAITDSASERSIISPAEAINAITVGALHHDSSALPAELPADVYDLLPQGFVSPITRTGLGYRRAIKPDVMFPGGRQLYRRQIAATPEQTTLNVLHALRPPGHRVAYPASTLASNTAYLRGTSNAAAIATRHAASLYDVIEELRDVHGNQLPRTHDAVLLKAMVAHGASWVDSEGHLMQARPDLMADAHTKKRYLSRWLGYGSVEREYGLFCTPERATMVGVGEASKEQGMVFKIPLPQSLAGKKVERRLTVTLAWLSPLNHASQAYRQARLWFSPPKEDLNVDRRDVQWQSARRGTLQHEILSGDSATSYSEGAFLVFKVSCAEDAGKLVGGVPFALVVSLEIAPGHNIPLYQEIAEVIAPKTNVAPIAAR